MEYDKVFVSNYLTTERFGHGLAACISVVSLCFIFSFFYWDFSSFISPYLALKGELLAKGEYWRLWSSLFVHSDMDHLLSNSLMLVFLTYFVTSFYGFLISPILSLFMGGVINYVVLKSLPADVTLVGISGVVYYLWGFWLILYILIDKHISLIRRIVKVTGLFLILLVPTTYAPNTSYLSHYFGFILGVSCGLIYYTFIHRKIAGYEVWKLDPVPELENLEDS